MKVSNKPSNHSKFMFAPKWQMYHNIHVDTHNISMDYSIEHTPHPNMVIALKRLNSIPSKKHILHIGLHSLLKNSK